MEPTTDVYSIVTSLILKQLQHGIVPWKQPWRSPGVPRNFATGRPYRGLNHLLLKSLNYSSNEFLTFKQVQKLGGKVKRGERGHLVIFWLWHDEKPEAQNQSLKPKRTASLRYYYVYNLNQCMDLPTRYEAVKNVLEEPLDACERIIANMPGAPKIVYGGNEAFYETTTDYISMPPKEAFYSPELFFVSVYHEMVHSTGAAHRLNRKEITEPIQFGSENYSVEELTAEIGACYLASVAGIAPVTFENNVAYIKHWLRKLQNDKRLIVHASARAQKAADYILGIKASEYEFAEQLEIQAP